MFFEGNAPGVTINDVTIQDCPESPCEVRGGAPVSGQLKFETSEPIPDVLDCQVLGLINNTPIPFPGVVTCNLKEKAPNGQGSNIFELGLTVPSIVPRVCDELFHDLVAKFFINTFAPHPYAT